MFDKCEICGTPDPQISCILPIRQKDGRLDTVACILCSINCGAYCVIHERPHLGFMDGSTACIWCVEQVVQDHKNEAIAFRNAIWAAIAPNKDEKERLDNAADISAEINESSNSVAVLRFLACAAVRSNQRVDDVLADIQRTKSVNRILGF